MDIEYIKNETSECLKMLHDLYEALNTFELVGYVQQKTNVNCMDGIKIIYEKMENIHSQAQEAEKKQNNVNSQ